MSKPERPRVEFNFTMQFKPGEFEKLTEDQKKRFYIDYLQQINCVLMGAILTSKDNLDFVLKINANLLSQVKLHDEIDKMRKSKGMIISIVYTPTGEGILLN